MARPLRIEFEGATYHVTTRGNRRDVIVRDDHDRRRWVDGLQRVVGRYQWGLLAFCLLDNHYHLFVCTPLANLSAGMLTLNSSYTGSYNRRHKLVGHLFQGRYKALLVEDDHHFDAISRYIHLNPVRAGLGERPEQWPWSSCPGYYRASRAPEWLDCATVLSGFGRQTAQARRAYRRFVEAGLGEDLRSPAAEAAHGLLLGSEAWVERIRALVRGGPAPEQVPAYRRVVRTAVERIAEVTAAYYGLEVSDLGRRQSSHVARGVFAHLARRLGQATLGELARWLGLKCAGSVHSLLHRFGQVLARSSRVTKDIAALRSRLTQNTQK